MLAKIQDFIVYNYRIKKIIRGFFASPFAAKNPLYRHLYDKAVLKRTAELSKKPFRVLIENTNICDADCVFCPHRTMKRPGGVMELGLSEKIMDECKRLGIEYVTIYGFGEPFMDKHFLKRVEYAKAKGLKRVTTNTNAAYMTKEKNTAMVDAGLDEIYISFDAFSSGVYQKIRPGLDFNKVKENIQDLIAQRNAKGKKKPSIILSFVENDLNKKEAAEYIKYWKGKVDGVSVSAAHNWTGDVSDYGRPGAGISRDPCRMIWADMFILYNGDVALCCNDYEGRVIIGNVARSSIEEIWTNARITEIRKYHLGREFGKVAICANCSSNYHHKLNWWISK